MLADNLNTVDCRKSLHVPSVSLYAAGHGSPLMIANDTNRRPRCGHHDPRRPTFATNGPESSFRQIKD